MDTAHIEKYAVVMKEIKLRKEVIDLFLSGERDAHYEPTTTETLGLQFRKIFELIVFASLAAWRVPSSRLLFAGRSLALVVFEPRLHELVEFLHLFVGVGFWRAVFQPTEHVSFD